MKSAASSDAAWPWGNSTCEDIITFDFSVPSIFAVQTGCAHFMYVWDFFFSCDKSFPLQVYLNRTKGLFKFRCHLFKGLRLVVSSELCNTTVGHYCLLFGISTKLKLNLLSNKATIFLFLFYALVLNDMFWLACFYWIFPNHIYRFMFVPNAPCIFVGNSLCSPGKYICLVNSQLINLKDLVIVLCVNLLVWCTLLTYDPFCFDSFLFDPRNNNLSVLSLPHPPLVLCGFSAVKQCSRTEIIW